MALLYSSILPLGDFSHFQGCRTFMYLVVLQPHFLSAHFYLGIFNVNFHISKTEFISLPKLFDYLYFSLHGGNI